MQKMKVIELSKFEYCLTIFDKDSKLVPTTFMRRIPLRYLKEFDNVIGGGCEKN